MGRVAHHQRQRAPLAGLIDPPLMSVLRPDERMHLQLKGSAGEQVRPRAAELPGTRSRQGKVDAAFLFVKAMHLVEQCWDPLDLIDDDPVASLEWRHKPLEHRRIAAQREKP